MNHNIFRVEINNALIISIDAPNAVSAIAAAIKWWKLSKKYIYNIQCERIK